MRLLGSSIGRPLTDAVRTPPQNDHPLVRSYLKHGLYGRIRQDTAGLYCLVHRTVIFGLRTINYVCIMSSVEAKSNNNFPKYGPRHIT